MPEISVVMPVYNAETFLQEAIDSILSQTFTDFEFVIVDDGSTDGSTKIIKDAATRDPRIVYHRMLQNSGIVAALNEGIRVSSGRLVARMDADDISLPKRLESQHARLNSTDSDVVGANYIKFQGSMSKITHLPTEPEDVARNMLHTCCLGHPVVTFTREAFDSAGGYDPRYTKGGAEDYDLWLRMSRTHKLANLDQPLLRYRRHKNSLTAAATHTDKYALNSACAVSNHFGFLYDLSGVSPHSDHAAIIDVFTAALDRCIDPWHRKCMKRWLIRFTRYCVTDAALKHRIKVRLFPHATVKEKLKWHLYRLI